MKTKTNNINVQIDSTNNEEATIETNFDANKGWALALAKVLQQEKPKHRKSLILSKFKDPRNENKKENFGFEIEGEIEEEKPNKEVLDLEILKKEKKNKLLALRVKPVLMDRERERLFKKIATKGVVQLFNAVRAQQKDLVQQLDAAGPLDHKREAVLNNINKKKFLDVLMGGTRAKSEMVDDDIKEEIKGESEDDEYTDNPDKHMQWSVLRDDFLSNKSMTHWDKDDDDSIHQQESNESNSD